MEDDSSEKENQDLLAQNKYGGSLDEEVGSITIFVCLFVLMHGYDIEELDFMSNKDHKNGQGSRAQTS